MADGGYKKPLFMSRALRPGGFGQVAPKPPGAGFSLGGGSKLTGIGPPPIKGVMKLPALAKGGMIPKMPKMPKMPKPPKVF
jgi:hypothetical protein